MDIVHGSDPCQLILFFQLVIDTFFLCQLNYKQVELISSLSVNVSEIVPSGFEVNQPAEVAL